MTKKLPDETREWLEELYEDELTVTEVARIARLPYSTVYSYTKVRQRVNPETGQTFGSLNEYREHLAIQKINPETGKKFGSLNEYHKYMARQRVNPETGKKFGSRAEYEEYTTRQRVNPETGKKFGSLSEYQKHLAIQKINPETGQTFGSFNEYHEYMARQRVKKPENQITSQYIKTRLEGIGMTQSWLAEQLEISKNTVSRYANGLITPRKNLQKKLFEALDSPYKSIDELVQDYHKGSLKLAH